MKSELIFSNIGTQAEHDHIELVVEEKSQPILYDAYGPVIPKEDWETICKDATG